MLNPAKQLQENKGRTTIKLNKSMDTIMQYIFWQQSLS